MLKGDVSATPLPDVLSGIAEQGLTGCLHIDDEAGDEALVYLKNGLVYAVSVPGRRPQLGARLISSGALAPEALAEALEAQETELQGWRLGELLIHLGYVERPVIEAFVLEQLREATFDLSRWPSGRYRFRKNEKTRGDVGVEVAVSALLGEVDRRRSEWEVIAGVVHGAGAVPVLSAGGLASAELTLDQDQWALLCKVDGERTIAQLARDCGFTTFEAGQIVFALVRAGLLAVEETIEEEPASIPVDEDLAPLGAALAAAFGPADVEVEVEPEAEPEPSEEEPPIQGDLRDELASLTAALADLPSLTLPPEPEYPTLPAAEEAAPVAEVVEVAEEPVVTPVAPVAPVADDPFGDSLARVSEALNALLGDALPAVAMPEPPKPAEPTAEEIAAARAEAERLERSREAAAKELAEAHALAEASRQQKNGGSRLLRRKSRTADDEAARDEAARAEAERLAEESARAEAERLAAEEATRAEAERVAAEEAARAEAERLAAEETARAEAERLAEEEARAEAERLAAEEAARAEAERLAAEEAARAEFERLAAEETARAEAERLAAAEAERVEAEQRAAEEAERAEAERLAAEEAAEAAEAAAQEAARAEIDRLAAEETAKAEEEAATLDAEPEPVSAFDVASLLRDLNDQPPVDTVETVEDFAEPEPEPAFAHGTGSRSGLSETAALLRELTSLGLDDEPAAPSGAASAAPRPAAPSKEQQKKRKGLFGR